MVSHRVTTPFYRSLNWHWLETLYPGEHQNRWQMDVPPQNGIAIGYATHYQLCVAQNSTGGAHLRCWSMFPLTRVLLFVYRFFEPRPIGGRLSTTARAFQQHLKAGAHHHRVSQSVGMFLRPQQTLSPQNQSTDLALGPRANGLEGNPTGVTGSQI